jgi:hypothetical protein
VPQRRNLQAVEGNMVSVEVDRCDRSGVRNEIAHDIAAAGSDRHDAVIWPERHRLHVDLGVLPNLRIDEPAESKCEDPVLDPAQREQGMVLDGALDPRPGPSERTSDASHLGLSICQNRSGVWTRRYSAVITLA